MKAEPRRFRGKWNEKVIVDVYTDGDYRLVVSEDGSFQMCDEIQLGCFFRRAPELDPEELQPHCVSCNANLLKTPVSAGYAGYCQSCM